MNLYEIHNSRELDGDYGNKRAPDSKRAHQELQLKVAKLAQEISDMKKQKAEEMVFTSYDDPKTKSQIDDLQKEIGKM